MAIFQYCCKNYTQINIEVLLLDELQEHIAYSFLTKKNII